MPAHRGVRSGSAAGRMRPASYNGAQDHFEAVIVGSGFGGSVTAYRLAEAGKRVCLLERGKPYPPGSFPRSPLGFSQNFWDTRRGLYGMFNVWNFSGIDALISSGLGGGSLIYANVMIRKDEHWFVHDDGENWPISRADLDPHYDRCESMLGVQKYPLDDDPYASTRKTLAFRDAAQRLGYDWFLPDLAVTFANEGAAPVPGEPIREEHPNLHGRTRYTCRLVGECDVGCNYGSKNSLDYNYLSAAKRHGAELRTCCEVKAFRPRDGGGFEVDYVVHEPGSEGSEPAPATITTDTLVLSAGTLGSTFLLLSNRDAFPSLSPALGMRFCGNGDLLTFALRCREEINSDFGPVITSAIRMGDAADADGSTGVGRVAHADRARDHGAEIGVDLFAAAEREGQEVAVAAKAHPEGGRERRKRVAVAEQQEGAAECSCREDERVGRDRRRRRLRPFAAGLVHDVVDLETAAVAGPERLDLAARPQFGAVALGGAQVVVVERVLRPVVAADVAFADEPARVAGAAVQVRVLLADRLPGHRRRALVREGDREIRQEPVVAEPLRGVPEGQRLPGRCVRFVVEWVLLDAE